MRLRRLIFFLLSGAVRLAAEPSPDVAFEQRIGAQLPLAAQFSDATGARHALGDYFHGKPVVLYFGYARCPQLCTIVADGTVTALRQIRPSVGPDLEVVALSIDPTETVQENAARKSDAIHRYGDLRRAAGWHFLTGEESQIRAVTDACGFRYWFDARSRQYAHPSGFVVVTPAGVVSRYFLGVDFEPAEVARAVERAARYRTDVPVVDLVLRCFRGDGIGGRYGAIIWRILIAAVSLTVLALAGAVTWMLRQERRAAHRGNAA